MSIMRNIQQPAQMGEDHSDEDSMSDDSTTDHSLKDSVSTPSGAGDHLVQDETKAVNFSKMLLYKILLVTGAALGVGMFFFLSSKEVDDFKSQVCTYVVFCYDRLCSLATGQLNMCIL
jgi:hypothetical protein